MKVEAAGEQGSWDGLKNSSSPAAKLARHMCKRVLPSALISLPSARVRYISRSCSGRSQVLAWAAQGNRWGRAKAPAACQVAACLVL